MDFFAASGLINAVTSITFGILVLVKNPKGKLNRIFFLMTIALFVWGIGIWRFHTSYNYQSTLFYGRVLSLGSLFIPVLFYHFTITILNRNKFEKILLKMMYGLSILILPFTFSQYFVKSVSPKIFFDFWPNPGFLYHIYLIFLYILPALYVTYLFIREHIVSKDKNLKSKLVYLELTILAGFGGGFTNFFLWYNIPIPPYGNILVSLFPFLLGYSMLKHKLFNAKAIATEILVYFILLILLVQLVISNTLIEALLRGLFLILIAPFAYITVRSSYREMEQKEKIEALNTKLREADELKSEFVSLATHHIATPLTAISGYMSMLNDGMYDEKPKEKKTVMETLQRLTGNMVTITKDFLDVSRIQKGNMRYDFANVDILRLVDDIANEFEHKIHIAKLELRYTPPSIVGKIIKADEHKLKQAISSVIENCIRYTKTGYINIKTNFENNSAIVEITDNGNRVLPAMSPKLFGQFTKTGDENEASVIGNSLGLYVTKEIVEAHGGELHVSHKENPSEWVFTISIPIK